MASLPEIKSMIQAGFDCHVQCRNGLRDQKALCIQTNFPVFLYSPSSAQLGSSFKEQFCSLSSPFFSCGNHFCLPQEYLGNWVPTERDTAPSTPNYTAVSSITGQTGVNWELGRNFPCSSFSSPAPFWSNVSWLHLALKDPWSALFMVISLFLREREGRQHRTDIVLGLQMGRWFEKTTARFHLHSGPVFHIWVQRPSFVFCHRKPNLDCLKLEISLKTNPQGQQLHRFGG